MRSSLPCRAVVLLLSAALIAAVLRLATADSGGVYDPAVAS
ncbi:hypothetical protein [Aeromicrobium sp. Sec7.5]